MKEGLKIISLDITNVRKIKAFKMELDGGNLHIAGDVSEGKTTAISALWEILTKSLDSISHGQKKGIVKIKLAGGSRTLFAERVTTPKASTLRISNENGDTVSAKDFNHMISGLAVNPHKIKDMAPQEQIQALLKSAKVDADIPKMDKDILDKETQRLDAYRDMDRGKPTGDKPEKAERINVSELVTQLDKAETVNRDNQGKRDLLIKVKEDSTVIDKSVAELEESLKNLKAQRKETTERIEKGEAVVAKLKDEDTQTIKDQLASAEGINDKAIAYESYTKAEESHKKIEKEHQTYDDEVKKLKADKKKALEGAQWPIDGLAITDGQIYFNDCLLDNLGESEQMLVCAALAMNDILAHDIRVVRMDGVESMSEPHLQKLVKIFNGHGIQVLSTRVSRSDIGEGEIEIVNGEYTEVDKG